MTRDQALEGLGEGTLDVLVIGGGIVGAGVARDAAARGLRVCLTEQYDMAWGTSSRSSRLLHGGLRYLAQGRVRLVREASIEKRIVHSIAPHVSAPLPFLFPTYQAAPWDSWAKWKLCAGVKLYDLLCGGTNFGPSSWLSAAKMEGALPGIGTQRLTGGVRYFDGITSDARLVLDTLNSAGRHGAILLNYCRFGDVRRTQNSWDCVLQDTEKQQEISVSARCVVNAAGPWAQNLGPSDVRLRLTKGVHLVVRRSRLPVPEAVVMVQQDRILFAIPWGQRVILGTTDTDYIGPVEDASVEPEDIDYVLRVVNSAFPEAGLSCRDVLSSWAGLRPLIASSRGGPSDISRGHQIRSPAAGWLDVAGGKLTTYRLMAEQAVDRIQKSLALSAAPCRTAREPLRPCAGLQPGSAILPPPVSRDAVLDFCENEWALHLEDVMVRRSGWHYYDEDPAGIAPRVARWMGEALMWDESKTKTEIERYLRSLPVVNRGGED